MFARFSIPGCGVLCLLALLSGCTQSSSEGSRTFSETDFAPAIQPVAEVVVPPVANDSVNAAAGNSPELASPTSPPVVQVAATLPLGAELPAGAREIKLLVPDKKFATEKKLKALRMSFDDIDLLRILNMEPVVANAADHLPPWLKELDGKRVVLRGWMFPVEVNSGIRKFLFTRDNGTCCFGPNAKIYDKIGVDLRKGLTVDYISSKPFDVAGTLRIDPYLNEEGRLEMLYRLENAEAIVK